MSRITGSKCKYCRREQAKLFLKGERCFSEKCALTRRQSLPGKNTAYSSRMSNYGIRLREKQKVKRTYGINETKMKNLFKKASQSRGDTGLQLLQLLELRLDNVVYLLGIAPSRQASRQIIGHGKIRVNNKKMTIPSFTVSIGDKISLADPKYQKQSVAELKSPRWLKKSASGGEVLEKPVREMIDEGIKEYLIIEFYSR